jgi:hypothetical protein
MNLVGPNNSFKPTPCRGVSHVLCATLAHVRRPATGRLNSGVRRLIKRAANMKTLFWLAAVIASGALGFYFGVNYGVDVGSKTVEAMMAENEVKDSLARIRISLNALERNDLNHANNLHKENLKFALLKIGTYSDEVLAYWECTDKDQKTILAAHNYARENPTFLNGQIDQIEAKALEFCTAKVDKKSGGA